MRLFARPREVAGAAAARARSRACSFPFRSETQLTLCSIRLPRPSLRMHAPWFSQASISIGRGLLLHSSFIELGVHMKALAMFGPLKLYGQNTS